MPERYCIWLVDGTRTVCAVWTGDSLEDGIDMWSILNESGPVNPEHHYTRSWM